MILLDSARLDLACLSFFPSLSLALRKVAPGEADNLVKEKEQDKQATADAAAKKKPSSSKKVRDPPSSPAPLPLLSSWSFSYIIISLTGSRAMASLY